MLGRDLTPPPSGRLSSSSESPDSLYKSSTDSHSSRTLNFSPDSTRTSTAFKAPNLPALPKFRLDDDSDTDDDDTDIDDEGTDTDDDSDTDDVAVRCQPQIYLSTPKLECREREN